MTSEVDALKTNEFLRRRRLRLQQVREQSKDIARKIRVRAKVEKLRQIVDLEGKKAQQHFQNQDVLVKELEQLYTKSVEKFGIGHSSASEVNLEGITTKKDLSRVRGREAAAHLRLEKQRQLDARKKSLDRKLQAREAANELSREKSKIVNKKSNTQTTKGSNHPGLDSDVIPIKDTNQNKENNQNNRKQAGGENPETVKKNDMATQWTCEGLSNEWEPKCPKLQPPADGLTNKSDDDNPQNKAAKEQRLDLFALSEDMPSSLQSRTKYTAPVHTEPVKSSLTLVSEYLQNRNLRLREPETTRSSKPAVDLQSLKETILRTRASKTEVSSKPDRNIKRVVPESTTSRQSAVTMYNHSTRDSRSIPGSESNLVIRELTTEEDAYSQAMRESSGVTEKEKLHDKKLQDMRTKVAMTKQTVEKEYKDTMAFLNSLPKDRTCKSQKRAFMNEDRQLESDENRQLRMEQEFRRIQNDYKLLGQCCADRRKTNSQQPNKRRTTSQSPVKTNFAAQDFEYSWMPVPESDASLAIHTIPTTLKDGKASSVKFSNVDSYHEYRSRHKHTPPTKESSTSGTRDRNVEKIVIQEDEDESTDYSTLNSESSSVENLQEQRKNIDNSDAERIIIYKIIESKADKSRRNKKSKNSNTAEVSAKKTHKILKKKDDTKKDNATSAMSVEQLREGVYKTVSEKGLYCNIVRSHTSNVKFWKPDIERKSWWNNIASMYFDAQSEESTENGSKNGPSCACVPSGPIQMQWDSGDVPVRKSPITPKPCKSCDPENRKGPAQESTSAKSAPPVNSELSTDSYKTAVPDKNKKDDDFVKLIDMAGTDAGKFYIGATGLLNNEGYEVVIQLRKKDAVLDGKHTVNEPIKEAVTSDAVNEKAKCNELPATVGTINVAENIQGNGDKKSKTTSPRTIDKLKSDENVSSTSLEINVINYDENSQKHISADTGDIKKNDASKPISIRKRSMSTYTQTTLNTPQQQTVFYHTSTSTSTTYMSPPELIPNSYFKQRDNNENQIPAKTKKSRCKCKKFHSRRTTESTEDYPSARDPTDKRIYLERQPNTLRNSKKSSDRRVNESPATENKKTTHKSSKQSLKEKESRHIALHTNRRGGNKDSQSSNKLVKSKLNPVIQNYVKRLLSLSNEGFKAIEVVNQECSSVTTPGSSIINVQCNVNKRKPLLENKISLEQLRVVLQQKIDEKDSKKTAKAEHKKKCVHKVKSLNISKQLLRKKSSRETKATNNRKTEKQVFSSTKDENDLKKCKKQIFPVNQTKLRSKSSPTPRPLENVENAKSSVSDITSKSTSALDNRLKKVDKPQNENKSVKPTHSTKSISRSSTNPIQNTTDTSSSSYLSNTERKKHRKYVKKQKPAEDPTSISTQTGVSADSDVNLMKLTESKIQNMEKIADYAEKCNQRILNLGRVLEVVRKNRPKAYSHISTCDSSTETELKSNRNSEMKSTSPSQDIELDYPSKTEEEKSAPETSLQLPIVSGKVEDTGGFVSLLEGIPKPGLSQITPQKLKPMFDKISVDTKARERPPPALSRIHIKNGAEELVPHELSTVIEVDSPMSVKLKSKSGNGNTYASRNLEQSAETKSVMESPEIDEKDGSTSQKQKGPSINLDLPQINMKSSKPQYKPRFSLKGSKMEMMDLQKFNEIMLKPFVTIEEFAKQCNIAALDECSNIEDIPRESAVNEDLSSLHSEGSLPDVIGELLKRNIISEPFKFDTASNVNSATVSSDSSFSILALAKMARDRKKSSAASKNKENIGETSDALSVSSNPDLENAFKKLGMGWASSTLKKTKEREALSSSSSSVSHIDYKLNSLDIKDEKRPLQGRNENKISKTVDQQTSLSKSMIVQEFLTNELAKRITFSKSRRNESDPEFVTMYETKLPDELKNTSNIVREERSIDSVANPNSRARTSTPVQLYRSITYRSSSSSNNASNGLFSNLDDLSSVKGASGSIREHSTTDKDDLSIPNYSLRKRRNLSKSDS